MLTARAFYDPLDAIKFDPELGLVVTPDPNIYSERPPGPA
jgi:hypothetical protein